MLRRFPLIFCLSCLLAAFPLEAQTPSKGIWITREEIAALPTTGTSWEAVKKAADGDVGPITLRELHDLDDVKTYARALVAVRLGLTGLGKSYRDQVIASVMACIGTEGGTEGVLSLSRNLPAVVIAADLVGLPADKDAIFRPWLDQVGSKTIDGDTLISIRARRPNNWGTQAGFALGCRALYLAKDLSNPEDPAVKDLLLGLKIHRGWLGDRASYAGFSYGDLSWQCDSSKPVGINPKGCTIEGHPMDGGLPEELRRASLEFDWPPPKENYCYTALEGALCWHYLLFRWVDPKILDAQDRAVLRAYRWLYEVAQFPPTGNDTWQPFLVNYLFGAGTLTTVAPPAQTGKSIGYTCWTHARAPLPPQPPPDSTASFSFKWDTTKSRWNCDRTDAAQTATGSGDSKNLALVNWASVNSGKP